MFLRSLCFLLVLGSAGLVRAEDTPLYKHTADVIYGRKFGTALTLDVLRPREKANGAAVIWVVSGGWFSNHDNIKNGSVLVTEFLKRGYTVFAVVHGSQPKFTIPEIIEDMHRAVRFIRANAERFEIDPDRIGVTGASAGGHLSLVLGTSGRPGNPKATDPVERASSKVQAVACFFPPTDFMNWGEKGNVLFSHTVQKPFRPALDFRVMDSEKGVLVPVENEEKRLEITREISPITHVTKDDAPTLIIHGDKDTLVPLQQAEVFVARMKEVGVPAELIVKKGAGHGWATILVDMTSLANWFDRYLAAKEKTDN